MLGAVVRFIVSAIVLLIVGWLLPGVQVSGFWGALIAAAVIAIIGWIVESLLGDKISPRSRGLVGFLTAAVIIYLAQFIIPAYLDVTILGALLASAVIGLVDMVVPTTVR